MTMCSAYRPSSAADGGRPCRVPTLQRLCEQTVARHMVEPRSALALLEFADAAGAQLLRQHSLAVSACPCAADVCTLPIADSQNILLKGQHCLGTGLMMASSPRVK